MVMYSLLGKFAGVSLSNMRLFYSVIFSSFQILMDFRYELEFFQNVVHGRDIVSWAAVDRSRTDGKCDELVGFVTARIVLAKESEVRSICI